MIFLLASTAGLFFSFGILWLLRPVIPTPWCWTIRGLVLHACVWLCLHASLTLLLGRPWFAMAIVLAFVMLIVQVSNAKYYALREPFVFQDFEYFTDAIRHPRLYIPFLGWWKFVAIVLVVGAALLIGLVLEFGDDAARRLALWPLLLGAGLLFWFRRGQLSSFDPVVDMARQGLFASLWDYGWAERQPLAMPSDLWDEVAIPSDSPDLLVVQSESFFDARTLSPIVRQDVLAGFDRLRGEGMFAGQLAVPAWGANTVRSEFAFLSGVSEGQLGVHRFNPYRRLWVRPVASLVSRLKAVGYKTICIHPYPASFYRRDRIYPHLGFDEFIDIRGFEGAERCGPYVSDRAVSDKVAEVLGKSAQPVFIFVITMENHGPLHLERVDARDMPALYTAPPPAGCEDLTVYLRHLRNADKMAGNLKSMLSEHPRAARFCWYGDHVPIMPSVYRAFGAPAGETEYFVWSNRHTGECVQRHLALHELAWQMLADPIGQSVH